MVTGLPASSVLQSTSPQNPLLSIFSLAQENRQCICVIIKIKIEANYIFMHEILRHYYLPLVPNYLQSPDGLVFFAWANTANKVFMWE